MEIDKFSFEPKESDQMGEVEWYKLKMYNSDNDLVMFIGIGNQKVFLSMPYGDTTTWKDELKRNSPVKIEYIIEIPFSKLDEVIEKINSLRVIKEI